MPGSVDMLIHSSEYTGESLSAAMESWGHFINAGPRHDFLIFPDGTGVFSAYTPFCVSTLSAVPNGSS